MEKSEFLEYWIKSAEYDLSSMEAIFNSGKYDWALFIGNLAVEKILKALWIKINSSNTPPKIHSLVKLAEESAFVCNEDQRTLLLEISNFNLAARYPDYKFSFHKKCTREFTENYISQIKEIFNCITKQI